MKTKDINSKPMDADKNKASKRKGKVENEIGVVVAASVMAPDYKVADAINGFFPAYGVLEASIREQQYLSFLEDKMKESK